MGDPVLRAKPLEGDRKKEEENLTPLQPGQSVYYLRQEDGGFSLQSAVYVGDIPGDDKRPFAVISQNTVEKPADALAAYRRVVAPNFEDMKVLMRQSKENPDIDPDKKPDGVSHLDKAAIQRLNPSRTSMVDSITASEANIRLYGKAQQRDDMLQQADTLKRLLTDLRAGRMTAEAYANIEKSAMNLIRRVYQDLGRDMPTNHSGGWEHALVCANDLQRALDEARRDIAAFRNEQLQRRAALAGSKLPVRQAAEYAFITGGMERMDERAQDIIFPYRRARNAGMSALGELLTATQWYHDSNPKKP